MDTNQPSNKVSAKFRAMADRIDNIDENEFAGAMVIIPPGGGKAIEVLLTDPSKDIEAFWAMAGGKVQNETQAAVNNQPGGFNRGRM